jgi:hypothetical protein
MLLQKVQDAASRCFLQPLLLNGASADLPIFFDLASTSIQNSILTFHACFHDVAMHALLRGGQFFILAAVVPRRFEV